jgi:hypothetical protein
MKCAPVAVLLIVLALAVGVSSAAPDGEDSWTPPPDARARLERILEDPVFQLEEPTPGPAQKMVAAVREFFFALFSSISHVIALNSLIMTILLYAAIAAALLGAGWLIVRMTRDRSALPGSGLPAIRRNIRPPRQDRSPEDLLAGARAAWQAGRAKDVLRLSIAASIMALRSAGYLPGDRSMTELEGARALERTGPAVLRAPFRLLVLSHDRLVYAGLQPDSGELDQALDLAARIVQDESGSEANR